MFVVLYGMIWICFLPIAFAKDIVIQPAGRNDALYEALVAASGDTIVPSREYAKSASTKRQRFDLRRRDGAKIVGNGSCPYAMQVDGGHSTSIISCFHTTEKAIFRSMGGKSRATE